MGQEITIKPTILKEGQYNGGDLEKLIAQHSPTVTDLYEAQLTELAEITYPGSSNQTKRTELIQSFLQPSAKERGSWVYYPWSNSLAHILNQADFEALLTNRNKLLITEEEQTKLAQAEIALFGLSVGNGIALACLHSGIGRTFYLADPDTFDTSNMNRVRVGIGALGKSKLEVTAQQMYEVNPFVTIHGFPEGVKEAELENIVKSASRSLVIFDEMDDFMMKIKTRLVAKIAKRPVIMLSSLGDSLLIDVERYDIDESTELFNGKLGQAAIDEIVNNDSVTLEDEKKYASIIVGRENVPERAMQSLPEIGKTLVGRPQLYSTVSLDGGFGAYIIRNITLNGNMPGGRYKFQYSDVFKS